jgi:DNA polymerase-4
LSEPGAGVGLEEAAAAFVAAPPPAHRRKIIHVDMDAFYASVEQRDDPALRDLPVAVGHGAARGVVAAASYEARTFGVRSAMPSTTALRLCPHLIFVRPRFEVYRAVSRHIHAIFARYTDLIEPLSLDEAYLDVTANRARLASASDTAREIRARILEATGLTASAGVSYNKLLAKLASDMRKPNGQYVIPPEMGAAFVASLPVERIPGVGPVTAAKMRSLGLVTGADLRDADAAWLAARFGKMGAAFHRMARGEDDRPVRPDRERKSAGSETTLSTDLTAPDEIATAVMMMAADVWAWRDKHAALARTVTVKLKYADFRIVTRSRTFAAPVTDRGAFEAACRELVGRLMPPERPVRLVGVSLHGFLDAPEATASAPQLALPF